MKDSEGIFQREMALIDFAGSTRHILAGGSSSAQQCTK